MIRGALAALLLLAAPAQAVTLHFPAPAKETADQEAALGSYRLPIGPWKSGTLPTVPTEGAVRMTAWRLEARDLSTLRLLADLRAQLEAAGYQTIFQCDTGDCGGFDFRYAMKVLPEPQMHVDLGDFRYLAARRPGAKGPEYVGLLVSRSLDAGFVEMVQVSAAPQAAATAPKAPAQASTPPAPSDIAEGLAAGGSVVLSGLSFASGSGQLSPGDYPALGALAAYMKDHPAQKITLVGHTDAVGGLAANIALSKRRAESVRTRLIRDYGADPAQIAAEGVGYLAPRASNLTKQGRDQNRRVEAMVDSTR